MFININNSKIIYKKQDNNRNILVIGCAGRGLGIHPWDILKQCRCGNKNPWLHYRKIHVFSDEEKIRYRVVCHKCFRHSHKGNYDCVVKEWNDMN